MENTMKGRKSIVIRVLECDIFVSALFFIMSDTKVSFIWHRKWPLIKL